MHQCNQLSPGRHHGDARALGLLLDDNNVEQDSFAQASLSCMLAR